MIDKIKIENFKSIQSLEIELGRLNVFIGANGSGKTNILEAIAMGSTAINNKIEDVILSNKGFRVNNFEKIKSRFKKKSNAESIALSFFSDENDEALIFSILEDNKNRIIVKKGVDNFIESFKGSKAFGNLVKQYKEDKDPPKGNSANSLLKKTLEMVKSIHDSFTEYAIESLKDFIIFAPENTFLRRFEDEGATKPIGVKGEGLFKHLVEIFKENPKKAQQIKENLQLLDWFEDFDIPKDLMFTEKRIAIKDRFLENGLSYFDQRSANEGFLFLLFYFTLFISDETPNFFAVDNIDTALNPKLGAKTIEILANLAKNNHKQAILTTHNPAILDGLNLNDDDQRLFVVYRNADGHTKVKRIFKKPTPEGQTPVRLSEQFLRGYLGGLPDNF